MAAVSFSNLHPDFKLGLLLVGTALLLDVGSSGASEAMVVHPDRLDLSYLQYKLLTASFGLGSLFIIGAGIWVDRRPPL